MKRNQIFAALALTLTVAGCDESSFLDTRPQGTLNETNLNSAKGVELLVSAAYQALAGPAGQEGSVWFTPMTNWTYGEVRSDNAYKGGGGVGDATDLHKLETFDVDATLGNLDSKWFQLYSCVQRCNSALKVLNTASPADVPSRDIRIAEMKVLRAHFYFELSRLFNRVPYFDENVDINTYADIPNTEYTRHEILGMIAAQLAEAAETLPETQAERGRVNKYVAYAYEAKVKLYQAYEEDEKTHSVTSVDKNLMNEVVGLCDKLEGRYSLLDNFQDLDLLAYENGAESVFAVQYSMNDGTSDAGRVNWSNLLNAPQGPYSGDGFFLPSQNLINAYKTGADGLPLFDTFNDEDYDVIATDASGNIVNTQVDSNVDPRLDFIVGRPNITWKSYPNSPCQASWVRDQGTYGQHCTKRFFVSPESGDMFKGWPWGASAMNWQVIRYAHVLLWKAEALIEIGDAASLEQARQIVNRIRLRAKNSPYVKDFNDPAKDAAHYLVNEYPAAGWAQEYARQALRFETRLETAMEGDRFFDLVRWGIATPTMTRFLNVERSKRVYYSNATYTAGRDEYLPIPLPQYNFSEGLYVQNPGYGAF
ncbi:MAG: RagB/SusD family nutrient uptake outer membrane protein [Mediterranea sp.]|jgi:hypothetical protein|nr:RagB/SusD family nutrient uptake outer membrane protein [Mediterranea sp.]